MGLDLVLGGMVLIAALRGWFKGFLLQAIRLAGIVACVYAADPVRDQVKPLLATHLPTVRPELVDRLLWWVAAGVSYVVLVGLACLIVKLHRKQAYGLEESNRLDQVGGFLFGALKGLVVVSFLVASVQKYTGNLVQNVPQAEEQVKSSKALEWDKRFHPAERIWTAPPVQLFVQHIQRMGLNPPSPTAQGEPKALQTAASRTPRLEWSSEATPPLDSTDPEIARAVEEIRAELRKQERPN